MNEPRKAGRQKKHLEDEHHFVTAEEPVVEVPETLIESPVFNNTGQGFSDDLQHQCDAPIESKRDESPIEEKIHELVEMANLDGWNPIDTCMVINMPPRNGSAIRVATKPQGDGVVAYWKKTRAFANATRRWEETGVWVDFISGLPVPFKPQYWKERF